MEKLFKAADRYVAESDWKIMAMIKFCLCSIGVLLGCIVPEKGKKPVMLGAGAVFIVTYIPLMKKLFQIFKEEARNS